MTMKLERKEDMCDLKQQIILYLFDFVQRKAAHGAWIRYEGQFKYDGRSYQLKCECKWDNLLFSYRKLEISEDRIIEIDIEDMIKAGLLH